MAGSAREFCLHVQHGYVDIYILEWFTELSHVAVSRKGPRVVDLDIGVDGHESSSTRETQATACRFADSRRRCYDKC